jgi:hypothetical protein
MTTSAKAEINLYGEVCIYSTDGKLLYCAKPDGHPAEKVAVLQSGKTIVLLRYFERKYGSFENLLLLRLDGTVVWRAQLPNTSSGDAYVDFEITDDRVFANSWSCYRVELDMRDGKILQRQFTK